MGKLSGIAHHCVRPSSNCEVILAWCLRGLTSLSPVLAIPSCVSMERMHDLSYFRSNFERIAGRLATRGNVTGLDEFRELDQPRRSAITKAEQLKARVTEQSAEIGKRRREGADTTGQQEQVRAMKAEIAALDEQVQYLDSRLQELLGSIQIGRASVRAR